MNEYKAEKVEGGLLGMDNLDMAPMEFYRVVNTTKKRRRTVRKYPYRRPGSFALNGDRMNATKMAKRYQSFFDENGTFFEDEES